MGEEQKQAIDSGSLHSDPIVVSDKFCGGIEESKLRELAARGIDKPETLSHAEIERICIEVRLRLARRDMAPGNRSSS